MDKLPLISQLIGPLTDLLQWLTGALHSYGLSIILFTILVKAVLAPLNLRQLHSARKMAALAPRIKELQQKYKGNREEMSKAQMALYKEEGANPAAGCLPLIIQMPVLYALFFVFQHLARPGTAAIYHQKFLWFALNHPDNLFGHFFLGPTSFWGPLPILAAVLQWIQQRMMMQPVSDPQQRSTQQIMQFMPLLILVFATNYPAGLALYWVTSTAFAIVLQYFVTGWGQLFTSPFKLPEAPAAPSGRGPSGPSSSRGLSGPTPSNGPSSPSLGRSLLGLLSGNRPSNSASGTEPSSRASDDGASGTEARRAPLNGRTVNGRARQNGKAGKVTEMEEVSSARPTPVVDDGQAATHEEADGARLGKMQRAAMRPKARPRSSKGAKR